MMQLDRVAKFYDGEALFTDLSWQLRPGKRIGLVGPNGAGKTTLFRILAGEVEPDQGRVVRPKGWTVGLLPQEVDSLEDRPVVDVVLTGRSDLLELETRIGELHVELDEAHRRGEPAAELEGLAHELADCQERFEHAGGYQFRVWASEILGGMGFRPSDERRSAAELSGGWRMRLLLARLLLQRPSVLLMDEPTNHLDLPSLEWLETFLQTYEGTVVVVSHDRYFLNRLVSEVAAFETDGFHTFTGNYEAYIEARETRLEQLRRERVQQDKKIKATERFIERFRYKNTKARQVQSRIKQLEKIERVELPGERKQVVFKFPDGERAGKVVFHLQHVTKRYGEHTVYPDLSLDVLRDERIALVGPNGEGKSTLLKLLAGEIRADGGVVERGHKVTVGYFAQHQVDSLNLSNTVLEEMESHAGLETRTSCRSILGAFLFSGDDVKKPVAVLSGGEKSRLALAKLLLRPTNLLLLDEPTNHLDMDSRDVLLQALEAYVGTILFVSHDRHFINNLATRVLHVEGGRVASYPGDYEYYHYKRSRERAGEDPDELASEGSLDGTVEPGDDNSRQAKREKKRREAELRNEIHRRTAGLKERLAKTEAEITATEQRVAELETELANPDLYADASRSQTLSKEYAADKDRLAVLYDQWADMAARIEGLEEEIAGS